MAQFTFPKDFLWGTASAAYQVEGNNKNSDWWLWENRDKKKDKFLLFKKFKSKWPLECSNNACDFYNKYEEDFDLSLQCNNNAIRLGLEWSRIEPDENNFNQGEIEHYTKVLNSARKNGLKTFVTLHHFTHPIWFAKKGGWVNPKSAGYFAKYSQQCAIELGDLIDVSLTINEPQVYSGVAYLNGRWPPQRNNPLEALIVQINFMRAHLKAYDAIKKVINSPVGIVQNLVCWEVDPTSKFFFDKLIVKLLLFLNTDFFIKPIIKKLDLIGVNYYFTNRIKNLKPKNPNDITSDLGWWLYPKGLENILINIKKYKLPIYITEHGLADSRDKNRSWYINESMWSMAHALEKGVDLKGYFHWALTDNYEWAEGFWPRFGLVEIDYKDNLKRTPRGSFYEYANICKNNTITR